MAVIQGINALYTGDGSGGKAALSIKEAVMRIIRDESVATYLTMRAPVGADGYGVGSIIIRQPYIPQSEAYSVAQVVNDTIQVSFVKVDINTQRRVYYEIETFDEVRLLEIDQIEGEIASGLATSIMADHNAHFFMGLMEFFNANPSQCKAIPNFNEPSVTEAQAKTNALQMAYLRASIMKTFSRKCVGVPGSEVFGVIDVFGQINMIKGLTTGNAGDMALRATLNGEFEVRELYGLKYVIGNFLDLEVPKGQSWAKDYDFDTTNFKAFVLHTEFAAMPLSLNQIKLVDNQNNANPRWIAKYQFGFGVIRPELGYAIVGTLPTANKAK